MVTAPLRGDGFEKLRQLADVVYDPWIDHMPLRIYSAEQLAERISAEGADIVVVESDSVGGPVFDLGLRAPDALHAAICRRTGDRMVTLDRRLAAAAATLGVAVEHLA